MVSGKDAALFTGILLLAFAGVFSTGIIDIQGSQSTNIVCSIPFVSSGYDACSTDVAQKYDVTTEIRVQATEQTAFLSESSFDYTTSKSGAFSSLSILGPSSELAFGGAKNVEVNFNLINSDGEIVADGNKYVGEIGILQSEKVLFNVRNQPQGTYNAEYELVYDPGFGGATQTENLEKQIRVPKRVE